MSSSIFEMQYGDTVIQNGLSGFLVLASCDFDDFPIALVNSKELAIVIADGMVSDVPKYIQDIFRMDASELACFKVLRFQEGRPAEIIHTRTARTK